MGTLRLEFLAHEETSLPHDVLVPRASGRNSGREDTDVVGYTVRKRTVLKTETIEPQALDGLNVADTRARLASHHDRLLIESQFIDKSLCSLEGIFPTSDTSRIGYDDVSKLPSSMYVISG